MDQQTKVALKHDQFVDTTKEGLEWASENRRAVITGAVALVVVVLLLVSSFVLYRSRQEQASVALGAAMAEYQAPLETPGQPVPAETKSYPTAEARAKAANALFVAAADKYGLTPAGRDARYFAGITYMEAGETASAESTLQQVASSWDSDIAALAKLSLAQLYRQTGRVPQAIDLLNQLAAKPTSTVSAGLAQLQLAELYDAQGQPDQARKVYAQLKDKDGKSAAGQLAAQKLAPATAAPQQ
ncbi:MAG: tetratricopeptide repeat protein [Acidobacteriota bacterium]|nr:tetratricopeptide repeat protein [Acidobacteriota bacterium]